MPRFFIATKCIIATIHMNELREEIKQILGVDSVHLEHPSDPTHGDFSTNIAMVTAQSEEKNPRELAEEYVERLGGAKLSCVAKIEVAGPGFINFYMDREFFVQGVTHAVKEADNFGKNKSQQGTKTIFEYTDPNPFKVFHIGHLMSNTIGEAFSRLAEFSGAEVRRVTYQGDVGMHVAKAIWGMQQMIAAGEAVDTIEALGDAYARGATGAKENEATQQEIVALNKKIYERSDTSINELYDSGRELSLTYFDTVYDRLGTQFHHNFFESESAVLGEQLVREHADVFAESDGAIVYEGEKHGLHTRVFVNSEGLPTYEAKELGLARIKYEWWAYDKSIVVTGNEINEYFKVLLAAMNEVYSDLASKTVHQSHGMLRLTTGKMSSRTGDVLSAEELLNNTQGDVLQRMEGRDIAEPEDIADIVAVGALKYAILRQAPGKDVVFDPEQALSFEGDSGPYIQYTYVRTQSILNKAGEAGIESSFANVPEEITDIERLIYQFEEVAQKAATEYAPHHVVTYITELASSFNSFYAHTKIVDSENEYASYYVAVTAAAGHILKNGLWLLGIAVPERM